MTRLIPYVLFGLLFSSCAEPLAGLDAPTGGLFYYPMSLAVAPDQQHVLVVSSNFDQLYNTGWVSVLDVNALTVAPNPLRVPSLAGRLSLDANSQTAILAYRGAGVVSVISLAGADGSLALSCGQPGDPSLPKLEQKSDCDSEHLINLSDSLISAGLSDPTQFRQYLDPYPTAIFSSNGVQLVAVGYLTSNSLSIFKTMPEVAGQSRLAVMDNVSIGPGALLSLTVHPNTPGPYLTGTSHVTAFSSDRSFVYDVDINDSVFGANNIVLRRNVGQDVTGLINIGLSEMTALAFSPDGQMAYATNRNPDALVVLKNYGFNSTQVPSLTVIDSLPIDRSQPTDIAYVQRAVGDLVVVAAMNDDALYFFAPQGDTLKLVYRLQNVGAGPFALAPLTQPDGRVLLFVTTFFDHGVSVIDMTSSNVTQFYRVAQIRDPSYGVAPRGR